MPFFHASSSRYRLVADPRRLAATVGVAVHAALVPALLALTEAAAAAAGGGVSAWGGVALALGAYALVLPPAFLWARRADRPAPAFLSPIGVGGVGAALCGLALLAGAAALAAGAPLAVPAAALDLALLGALSVAPGTPFEKPTAMPPEEDDPETTLVLPRGEPRVFAWELDDPLGVAAGHTGSRFELSLHLSPARYRRASVLPRERTSPAELLRLAALDRNPELRQAAAAIAVCSRRAGLGPMQGVLNVCAFVAALRRVASEDGRGRPAGTVLRSPTEVLGDGEGELPELCLLAYRLLEETGGEPALFWRASPLGGLEGRIALGLRAPAALPAVTVADLHSGLPYLLLSPDAGERPAGGWRWRLLDAEDTPGFRRIVR